MHMTNEGLVPLDSRVIRGEEFVRARAIYMKNRKGSGEQKVGWVIGRIFAWNKAGGLILTPRGDDTLVLTPAFEKLDGFVHPSQGGPVFRELRHFKLLDPTNAFHEDGKRTMNAFLKKAEGELLTTLDIRLLSMVFWIGAAEAIEEHRAGNAAPVAA